MEVEYYWILLAFTLVQAFAERNDCKILTNMKKVGKGLRSLKGRYISRVAGHKF